MPPDPVADRLYLLVGQRVRRRREDAKLTQEQLALRLNLKRTSITNVEKGRQHLPLHQLLRLAGVLGLELRDLMPTRDELAEPTKLVPVKVGKVKRAVTPQMAKALADFLTERTDDAETS